ncbi:MAG: hypothetical protein Q9203_007708, partial [Teloschistes exilis]
SNHPNMKPSQISSADSETIRNRPIYRFRNPPFGLYVVRSCTMKRERAEWIVIFCMRAFGELSRKSRKRG